MPFYEYECADCAQRVEVLQQISDEPLSQCPTCNAQSIRRLVSAAGFRLKGSGWYATDFKNKGMQAGDKGEDKTEKAAALKEETGSGSSTSASSESKLPSTTADQ
ncbi:MAG: FmdB family zinc ribbon protein [Gammaproteobacteria bacterium]